MTSVNDPATHRRVSPGEDDSMAVESRSHQLGCGVPGHMCDVVGAVPTKGPLEPDRIELRLLGGDLDRAERESVKA